MLFAIVPVGQRGLGQLELAPWTWKGGRNVDPGLYTNVFDDLDTSPVFRRLWCSFCSLWLTQMQPNETTARERRQRPRAAACAGISRHCLCVAHPCPPACLA